jgi:uridine phosphorylase
LEIPLTSGGVERRAIINPSDEIRTSGRARNRIPREIILCFTGEVVREARKRYDVKLLEKNWWGWLCTLKAGGSTVGLLASGIGDSFAGIVIELLIARGATDVLAIGTAGSLQSSLEIGDLVLTTRAIRDEGVSYHYAKPAKFAYPSPELNRRVEGALKELGVSYVKGTTWTTDAPYRETFGKARRFQKEGALCVEMEAASLFAIAKFRRVRLGTLHWISDDISRLRWNPQFESDETAQGRDEAIEAAVKTFSS